MTTTIRTAFQGTRVHHATVAKAERLEIALKAEYPGVELDVNAEEDGKEYTILATCGDAEATFEQTIPTLAEVLDALQDDGATEEDLVGQQDEDDEGEQGSKSVVQEQYREEYRLVSTNKQTNGDWLAETLTSLFWDAKTGFSVGGFEACCDQNGVDMSAPWAQVAQSGRNGWQGRFRMNGRQAMEKRVCVTGTFRHGEEVTTPDADADFAGWLADARERHAGYLAKLAKQAAKEEAPAAE